MFITHSCSHHQVAMSHCFTVLVPVTARLAATVATTASFVIFANRGRRSAGRRSQNLSIYQKLEVGRVFFREKMRKVPSVNQTWPGEIPKSPVFTGRFQERKQQMRHLRWGGGWRHPVSSCWDWHVAWCLYEWGNTRHQSLSLYIYKICYIYMYMYIYMLYMCVYIYIYIYTCRHINLTSPKLAVSCRSCDTGGQSSASVSHWLRMRWCHMRCPVHRCTERNMLRCRNVWTVNVESERWDFGKVSPPISE